VRAATPTTMNSVLWTIMIVSKRGWVSIYVDGGFSNENTGKRKGMLGKGRKQGLGG